jgi:hypothetical protein
LAGEGHQFAPRVPRYFAPLRSHALGWVQLPLEVRATAAFDGGTADELTCYRRRNAGLDGDAAVQIYLFRRKGSDRSFAYSLDATGRNIRITEDDEWVYVGMVAPEQLKTDPDALRQLRANGFYIFEVS